MMVSKKPPRPTVKEIIAAAVEKHAEALERLASK